MPDTLKNRLPVTGELVVTEVLVKGRSKQHALLMLPRLKDTDIASNRLPRKPGARRPMTDESEHQTLATQVEKPTRAFSEEPDKSNERPEMMTYAVVSPAYPFASITAVSDGVTNDNIEVIVPRRFPRVAAMCLENTLPPDARTTMLVSDIHMLTSLLVLPVRDRWLTVAAPNITPDIVAMVNGGDSEYRLFVCVIAETAPCSNDND